MFVRFLSASQALRSLYYEVLTQDGDCLRCSVAADLTGLRFICMPYARILEFTKPLTTTAITMTPQSRSDIMLQGLATS